MSPKPPAPDYDGEYYDGDYVLLPREGKLPKRILLTVVTALAVLGVSASVLLVWVARQITPTGPQGDKVASLVIPKGATLDVIGDLLEDNGVVSNGSVFSWYARWTGAPAPQAGEYVDFHRNSAMADAVDVLSGGPVPDEAVVLTIIPGMWLDDALAEIAETFPSISKEALQLTLASGEIRSKYLPEGVTNWEGFLLPETYQFSKAATAKEILTELVSTFDEKLDELGYGEAESRTGRTAYELVTIASMIERETGEPAEERGKIARVIFNRLDVDMALGIDATIYYGLGRKGGSDDPLTSSDLDADTPYNWRKYKGLPPTPIALASFDSLAAAINPLDGAWKWYVLVNADPPTHFFTDVEAEFVEKRDECRRKGLC